MYTLQQACMEVGQLLQVLPAKMDRCDRVDAHWGAFRHGIICISAACVQVHDLQEALNEKELELLELKQRHAQLQVQTPHAKAANAVPVWLCGRAKLASCHIGEL